MTAIKTCAAWGITALAGVVAGTAFAASLLVLNLVPRLMEIFEIRATVACGLAVTLGAVLASALMMGGYSVGLGSVVGWGALACGGVFVGMLSSALSEMLELLPVMLRYTRLTKPVLAIVIALMLGKAFGAFIAPVMI